MTKEKQTIGKSLSRFVLVISALAFGIKMMFDGLMSPEKLILFLLLVTIAAAIDSSLVKLIMALSALVFVIIEIVGKDSNQFHNLLFIVLALLIVLFGMFVIFGGLRKKK